MASRTYSFKDTSGAFMHPLVGPFTLSGQIGMSQYTVSMAQDKTTMDVAADGTVMPSFQSGDNGSISIEVQQTSKFHSFLLNWYNVIKTLADNQDVTNWASATLTLRSLVDGSQHILTGVCPSKIPDKTYAAQGQKITWTLLAASIQNL